MNESGYGKIGAMKAFVGIWRLVAVEDRQPDGEIIYPYGENPAGMLVYDASGRMAVQIMRRERQPLSSDTWAAVAPDEVKNAVAGFTAFFGAYEVDESEKTIIHHVEGHVLPNSVGKRLKRSYEFSGNQLILRPSPTRRVVWERVG